MGKKNQLDKIAKENGYYEAVFQANWNGYEVYSAQMKNKDENPKIGMPVFILYKSSKARIATNQEWEQFVDVLPD